MARMIALGPEHFALPFGAIGFGMAEEYYLIDFEQPVDIAYTPQFNTWRGQTSIQLLLKDIRPAQ